MALHPIIERCSCIILIKGMQQFLFTLSKKGFGSVLTVSPVNFLWMKLSSFPKMVIFLHTIMRIPYFWSIHQMVPFLNVGHSGPDLLLKYVIDICFVSESHILICDTIFLFVFNVQTNEIEHRICLPRRPVKHLWMLPKQVGKQLTLLAQVFFLNNVSQLIFQNIDF
jgi:hypothetical protein